MILLSVVAAAAFATAFFALADILTVVVAYSFAAVVTVLVASVEEVVVVTGAEAFACFDSDFSSVLG